MPSSDFTVNELSAMVFALEAQIDDCQDYLSSAPLSLSEKRNVMDTIKHSKSALQKLNLILSAHHLP